MLGKQQIRHGGVNEATIVESADAIEEDGKVPLFIEEVGGETPIVQAVRAVDPKTFRERMEGSDIKEVMGGLIERLERLNRR